MPGVAAVSRIALNRGLIVRVHLTAIVVLVLLSLAGQASSYYFHHDRLGGLVRDFDLDQEGNVPTWFQSLALAFTAALLFVAAAASRERDRRQAPWWRAMGVGMVLLSLDEASSFHERMRLPVEWLRGMPAWWNYSWVVAGACLVVLVGVLVRRWFNTLPGPTRRLLGLAGCLYVLGAVGFEALGGLQAATTGVETPLYVLTCTIEETMEMVATLIAIVGLLGYLEAMQPPAPLHWGRELAEKSGASPDC